ncbi:MAG: acyltransferase [Treponema sp.]|nr:acyltransferase [Treponema sp.]
MKRPFAIPVIKAFPAIDTAEPRVTPWVIALARLISRFYVAAFIGNARIYLDESAADIFIPAMERAFSRQSRSIVAFRHQNGWEPQALMWFTLYRLAGAARRRGVRFSLPPCLLFVHGYELFRTGGLLTRFMLPRFGAMPVHHAKLDSAGLNRIYRCLREGPYPLAMAPEGQVSYTLAEEPRVEPGTVRIGLAVARQLMEGGEKGAGGNCPPVEILPVSLYPEYGRKALNDAAGLLRRVERICGIERAPSAPGLPGISGLNARFLRCRETILALNEKRYGLDRESAGPGGQDFGARLDAVIDAALRSAAAMLRIDSPSGDTVNRLYAIRQICWDRIFPENIDLAALPALERAALDLRAGEAWHASRHMELADFSFYFHRPPAGFSGPDPSAESIALAVEYAQNLYDFASRTMGGTYDTRKRIAPAAVRISAAQPINLAEMLAAAAGPGGIDREHWKTVSAEANELLKERLSG